MPQSLSASLKYKLLWLSLGYLMIVFVIYSSLSTSDVVLEIKLSDKLMHVLGYFGLMGWFMQIYRGKRAGFFLALLFIAMGIALEFLQDLGGVRYFEVADMLANTLGVLLAWGLSYTPAADILLWFERRLMGIQHRNAA